MVPLEHYDRRQYKNISPCRQYKNIYSRHDCDKAAQSLGLPAAAVTFARACVYTDPGDRRQSARPSMALCHHQTNPAFDHSAEVPTRAVKVLAQRRPAALMRLLNSLSRALYPAPVSLHIFVDGPQSNSSIDQAAQTKVTKIANNWQWQHGLKAVIAREKKVGLREQWLGCFIPQSPNDQAGNAKDANWLAWLRCADCGDLGDSYCFSADHWRRCFSPVWQQL